MRITRGCVCALYLREPANPVSVEHLQGWTPFSWGIVHSPQRKDDRFGCVQIEQRTAAVRAKPTFHKVAAVRIAVVVRVQVLLAGYFDLLKIGYQ